MSRRAVIDLSEDDASMAPSASSSSAAATASSSSAAAGSLPLSPPFSVGSLSLAPPQSIQPADASSSSNSVSPSALLLQQHIAALQALLASQSSHTLAACAPGLAELDRSIQLALHAPASATSVTSSSSSSAAAARASSPAAASSESASSYRSPVRRPSSAHRMDDDDDERKGEPSVPVQRTYSPHDAASPAPSPAARAAPWDSNSFGAAASAPFITPPAYPSLASAVPAAASSSSSAAAASSSSDFPDYDPRAFEDTAMHTGPSDEDLVREMLRAEEEEETARRRRRAEEEDRAFQELLRKEATCARCGTVPDAAHGLIQMCDESQRGSAAPSCSHKICHACLQQYLRGVLSSLAQPPAAGALVGGKPAAQLTEADLRCPAAGGCDSALQQWQMKQVLDVSEFETLLSGLFKNALQNGGKMAASAAGGRGSRFVSCPNAACSNTFEAVEGSGDGRSGGPSGAPAEVGLDGQPMSVSAKLHRARHRFRCNLCGTIFCGECSVSPYHDGFDCAQYANYLNAAKCRFCSTALTAANTVRPAPALSVAAPFQHPGLNQAVAALGSFVGSVGNFLNSAASSSSAAAAAAPVAAASSSSSSAAAAPAGKLTDCCNAPDCLEKRALCCEATLPCSHACGGIRGERNHLVCLKEECPAHVASGCDSNEDDFCNICYVEGLGQAPAIQLQCQHVFHMACISNKLNRRWPGARITFGFLNCPLCKKEMSHPALAPLMAPLLALKAEVQAKATDRLKHEGMDKDDAFMLPTGRYYKRKDEYAMDRFAFYICSKCKKSYYGGRRQCEEAGMGGGDDRPFKAEDLLCGGCTAGPDVKRCAKHGVEYIEHKCKFCCSVASWYCWGSTHFCESCHKKQESGDYMSKKPASALDKCPGPGKCPLGVKHPPNGTEFTLGCGICRPRDC